VGRGRASRKVTLALEGRKPRDLSRGGVSINPRNDSPTLLILDAFRRAD
jgi:hypothetical protein